VTCSSLGSPPTASGTCGSRDWEGVDAQGVPHGSLNHYSKGTVATFLHRYVAGLRPVTPGYRHFEVRPRPGGGITSASSCHAGPFGPIKIAWRSTGGSMELDLLVPGGSKATVVIPGGQPVAVGPGRHRWTAPAG
jgi:alpha-L-rhamnosidase